MQKRRRRKLKGRVNNEWQIAQHDIRIASD